MINDVTGGNYVITATSNLEDVRKYTASSFYNWEQDNIPIDDLESRTNSLGASIGLTATGIDGATLVLSGTADTANSVYDNIDDIVNRIPKILTFPLLVEICNYGNLGDLKLEGITIKDNGSLEIINRNHGQALYGDSTNSYIKTTENATGYPFGTELGCVSVSSTPIYTAIAAAQCARHSVTCYSAASWNQNIRAFGTKHSSTNTNFEEPIFWTSGTNAFITGTSHQLSGNVYDSTYDVTVSADADPLEFNTASQQSLRDDNYLAPMVAEDIVSPMYAYGNYFTSVKVENCHGAQIQLKNVCVDGVSATGAIVYKHDNSIGFDIQNSDVVLTSCASFRNTDAGFKITNSNVDIEGGIIGYRNYPLDGGTTNGSRTSSGFVDTDIWDIASNGNGFEASRSTIKFDETLSLTNVSGTSNLGKHGFMMMSNGGNGWLFDKCKVIGGVGGHNSSQEQGAGNEDFQTTQLISAFNKINGFTIDSSQVKYQGILRSQGNEIHGIHASNSTVGSMGLISEVNGDTGLLLDSSEYVYNIGANKYTTSYDLDLSSWISRAGHSENTPAVLLDLNSVQNLTVTNSSKFSDNKIGNSGRRAGVIGGRSGNTDADRTQAMFATNGSIVDSGSVSEYEKGTVPLISVSNNSYARLLGLAAQGDILKGSTGNNLNPSGSVKGRVLSVTDNSKVDLYGTSAYNTTLGMSYSISSVEDLKPTWTRSAVYAGQNSKIRISGPTKISNFGVAALAEDNSKIEIGPALSELGTPDISLDPTDPSGHSLVELHATRACLVANNKSTIEMIKCGAAVTGATINSVEDNLDRDNYHSNSFIQFYPNGFTEELMNPSGGKYEDLTLGNAVSSISGWRNRNTPGLDSFASPNRLNHNSNSTGGMCVRAVGGSNVIVDQSNFEVRMNARDLSGAYYNIDGSGNEGIGGYTGSGAETNTPDFLGTSTNHYAGSQIFMWNIADNSRIVASNLKVNSVDPSAAGFHGPSGRWGVPSDVQGGTQQSMGPLDYYGDTGAYQVDMSKAAGQYNHGPFRLMAGISSDLMSYFETVDTNNDGIPMSGGGSEASGLGGTAIAQINAQGYAAPGIAASGIVGADYRSHSLMEPSRNYSGGINVYGQPIFGGRPGIASTVSNIVGLDRRYLSNSMLEDSELTPAYNVGSGSVNTEMFPQFPIPPIHMEWQGYLRNFLDESAGDTFANAKHGANKLVKLCSIFRSNTDPLLGGEGRDGSGDYTFGHGVRSLNIFDLNKLV